MKRALGLIARAIGGAALIGLAAWWFMPERDRLTPSTTNADTATLTARGATLARIGDCYACHTARGGAAYAGGLEMGTPFGALYTTNITPDPDTGIGRWTADDFWRALHDGRSKDGSYLYPAMPFTNTTKLTREDSDALYAYFKSVAPVKQANRPHALGFPYNQRELMRGWRALYFKPGSYQPDPKQTAQWNRGAYLVEGLGHCNACHSTRNAFGAISADDDFSGGLIPVQNWYAPSLASNRETGIAQWSTEEIVDLLRTGVSKRGAVYGPMSTVVQHGLQYASVEDLTAMAVYLKATPQKSEPEEPPRYRINRSELDGLMARGSALYEKHCATCHQADGQGVPRVYPPLAGNHSITMAYPINAIRMVLNGGFPPATAGNPRPYGMPPFGQELSDEEVAAVVTYIRKSWGNNASGVPAAEIARGRGVPND